MKRVVAVLCLGLLAAALAFAFGGKEPREVSREDYLRIHVRANSDSEEDQSVKYLVRDAIVAYLTPVVASCGGKEEAMEAVRRQLPRLEGVAEETLERNGFFYGARASLRREAFPTRVYDGATLPSGVYDALILELGTGEGDNWWCVVYPPLCFRGGAGNPVYKSRIAEIIEKFFG